MGRIEKTIFVSYRRTDESWGLAIFQNLTQHGYDVFIDYDGIASGNFETVILENIRARAHFLALLTPTALERCSDPKDWMRREIEAALDSRRNIVPLMLQGFDFGTPAIAGHLVGKLAALKEYNGLEIPKAKFFSSEMERLRNRFLNVPVDAVLHPASDSAQQVAKEQKGKAAIALDNEQRKPPDAVPEETPRSPQTERPLPEQLAEVQFTAAKAKRAGERTTFGDTMNKIAEHLRQTEAEVQQRARDEQAEARRRVVEEDAETLEQAEKKSQEQIAKQSKTTERDKALAEFRTALHEQVEKEAKTGEASTRARDDGSAEVAILKARTAGSTQADSTTPIELDPGLSGVIRPILAIGLACGLVLLGIWMFNQAKVAAELKVAAETANLFILKENQEIQSNVYGNLYHVNSVFQCQVKCRDDDKCKSYSFDKTYDKDIFTTGFCLTYSASKTKLTDNANYDSGIRK